MRVHRGLLPWGLGLGKAVALAVTKGLHRPQPGPECLEPWPLILVANGIMVDDGNLQRTGDTWESGSFANVRRAVTLSVHGNTSSFDLNPEEGC